MELRSNSKEPEGFPTPRRVWRLGSGEERRDEPRGVLGAIFPQGEAVYSKRRRRRLLATTETDDSAIAAAATIGVSRPKAASGMAAEL